MGAPVGNRNGAKGKWWETSLRAALSRSGGSIRKGLAPIADKVVAAAASGDMEAIREIANRLDGKPTERIEQTVDHRIVIEDELSAAEQLLTEASERLHVQ